MMIEFPDCYIFHLAVVNLESMGLLCRNIKSVCTHIIKMNYCGLEPYEQTSLNVIPYQACKQHPLVLVSPTDNLWSFMAEAHIKSRGQLITSHRYCGVCNYLSLSLIPASDTILLICQLYRAGGVFSKIFRIVTPQPNFTGMGCFCCFKA